MFQDVPEEREDIKRNVTGSAKMSILYMADSLYKMASVDKDPSKDPGSLNDQEPLIKARYLQVATDGYFHALKQLDEAAQEGESDEVEGGEGSS